ncbi:hypothetical protein Bhyg_02400, partial [Pseudolycoriella hygida]
MPNKQFLLLGDYNLKDSITWVVDSDGTCKASEVEGTIADSFIDFLSLTNLNQFNNVKNKNDRSLDLVLCNMDPTKLSGAVPVY